MAFTMSGRPPFASSARAASWCFIMSKHVFRSCTFKSFFFFGVLVFKIGAFLLHMHANACIFHAYACMCMQMHPYACISHAQKHAYACILHAYACTLHAYAPILHAYAFICMHMGPWAHGPWVLKGRTPHGGAADPEELPACAQGPWFFFYYLYINIFFFIYLSATALCAMWCVWEFFVHAPFALVLVLGTGTRPYGLCLFRFGVGLGGGTTPAPTVSGCVRLRGWPSPAAPQATKKHIPKLLLF